MKKRLALTPPSGAPPSEAVHWRLGNIWEKMGHKPAARADYQAALAINPGFQPASDSLKALN